MNGNGIDTVKVSIENINRISNLIGGVESANDLMDWLEACGMNDIISTIHPIILEVLRKRELAYFEWADAHNIPEHKRLLRQL